MTQPVRGCTITITDIQGNVRKVVVAALRQYADDIEYGAVVVGGAEQKIVLREEAPKAPPKPPLTQKQGKVYAVLVAYHTRHTYMPSIREAAKILGIASSHAIYETLRILARKGYIEITPGVTRGIKLL